MIKIDSSTGLKVFSEWSLSAALACHHAAGLNVQKALRLGAYCQAQGTSILEGRQWSDAAKDMLFRQLGRLPSIDWRAAEQDWQWAQSSHHHLLSLGEKRYPVLLSQIATPPLLLYATGHLALMRQPKIAIVGARHPTAYGLERTRLLSSALSQAGYTVVSGLAAGIDGAAHQAALTQPGKTVAVLGHGLNHCFPKQHDTLKAQIVTEGGLLCSEFSPHTPAKRHHFPQRNRIVSGLSVGVLVTQAMIKSGSLITARYALSEGREVFAMPGPADLPQSLGCHALIQQGATLVNQADDVWENLPVHWQASEKKGGYQTHFLF